jgi:serine acetyltransferase
MKRSRQCFYAIEEHYVLNAFLERGLLLVAVAKLMVLPNVTIDREALIGAGSFLTKDTPDLALAFRGSAKVVTFIPYEERLWP